jgi:hypothetical protein
MVLRSIRVPDNSSGPLSNASKPVNILAYIAVRENGIEDS